VGLRRRHRPRGRGRRSGKARRDELSGSTITLTSLGALGGIVSTPDQPPRGGHRRRQPHGRAPDAAQRPGGGAQMMNLSSSFDHRVVDGMDAAQFIQAVRGCSKPGPAVRGVMHEGIDTKLLVIGGGPGGYVAAIRAGQLGMPTVLVEGRQLGGTCLNIGCIPSKALIHAAEQFDRAPPGRGLAAGHQRGRAQIDIAQTVRWKDGIVDRLTGGVGALLRKAGVQVLKGWAHIEDGKTVVQVDGEPCACAASTCCWPPAPSRSSCPACPSAAGHLVIHRSAVARQPAQAPGRRRRRLHRPGAGHGLPQAGRGSHGGRGRERVLPSYDEELTQPVLDALKKAASCCTWAAACRAGTPARRARAQRRAPRIRAARRPRAGGRGPQAAHRRLRARIAAARHGRAPRGHRRALPHLHAQRLGHWRRDRRAHAGAPRHGAGRMVAEIAGKNRRFEPMAIPPCASPTPRWWWPARPRARPAAGIDCIEAPSRSPPTAGP
jgi:dihydrolipoamide dehydrogenase